MADTVQATTWKLTVKGYEVTVNDKNGNKKIDNIDTISFKAVDPKKPGEKPTINDIRAALTGDSSLQDAKYNANDEVNKGYKGEPLNIDKKNVTIKAESGIEIGQLLGAKPKVEAAAVQPAVSATAQASATASTASATASTATSTFFPLGNNILNPFTLAPLSDGGYSNYCTNFVIPKDTPGLCLGSFIGIMSGNMGLFDCSFMTAMRDLLQGLFCFGNSNATTNTAAITVQNTDTQANATVATNQDAAAKAKAEPEKKESDITVTIEEEKPAEATDGSKPQPAKPRGRGNAHRRVKAAADGPKGDAGKDIHRFISIDPRVLNNGKTESYTTWREMSTAQIEEELKEHESDHSKEAVHWKDMLNFAKHHKYLIVNNTIHLETGKIKTFKKDEIEPSYYVSFDSDEELSARITQDESKYPRKSRNDNQEYWISHLHDLEKAKKK